jgi:hypothetical protein
MLRSSFLIAACAIVLLTPSFEDATAEPRLPLNVASPLLHNAGTISNCQYRHPDGTICKVKGDWPYTDHIDKDCRCVHIRVITGGRHPDGPPGSVEVRSHTIRGSQHPDGPPGSVEVRSPD